jgi:hypothetical protein
VLTYLFGSAVLGNQPTFALQSSHIEIYKSAVHQPSTKAVNESERVAYTLS